MLQTDARPAPTTTVSKKTKKLTEPVLGEIALKVLGARYLMKNEAGEIIETPKQLFERVAKHIAEAEANYGGDPEEVWPKFYELLANRDYMPNTPCLVNAGRPNGLGQFSACFVLPVPDTMHDIFTALRNTAMVHKSGGGTGFSFSRIRPKNDFVASTTGIASGPVSFMRAFDHVTECVKQSGVRRGANMGILRCDHPDILEFIDCKQDTSQITNFNISVGVTDAFMAAVAAGADYDLINPRNGKVTGQLNARMVWDKIINNAWNTGEPGLFFLDRANNQDPVAHLPGCEIEATNPCGEVPLAPYNACTLGSINLSRFVVDDRIDFDRLTQVAKLATHFLDNVLDQNKYPVQEMADVTRDHRKIGLGVMGWADTLVKLGIPYASNDALQLATRVMQTVNEASIEASEKLAELRGAFPLFGKSRLADGTPRRNATTTVIAPTGSISIIAECSGGCEPLFALCQVRNQADMQMVDFSPLFETIAKREGFWSENVRNHVMETGSVQGCDEVPERWREVFKTANEIPVSWHVKMQAAFQRHTQDAVSKTINLHQMASVEEVENAYQLAWDEGCKGITVYRDKCRDNQTLTAGAQLDAKTDPELYPIPNDTYDMKAAAVRTPAGKLSVKLGLDRGRPFEIWLDSSRGGTAVNADTEAIGRLASLVLRLDSPVPPERRIQLIADQLTGIGGGDAVGLGSQRVRSLPDGLSKALRKLLKALEPTPSEASSTLVTPPQAALGAGNGTPGSNGQNGSNGHDQHLTFVSAADICPSCHQVSLQHAEGCATCRQCGFSKC